MKFKDVLIITFILLTISCKKDTNETSSDSISQEKTIEENNIKNVVSNKEDFIEVLKKEVSNINIVLDKYKPTKNTIELKETNQETLSNFNFAKDAKTTSYFDKIEYLGIQKVYEIDSIEGNSKHLFVFRVEGSMRNHYLDCFVYDSQKEEYYLKWQFNRDITIVLYHNKYEFLSINRDFENWKLKGITFFNFKKNYLQEGESFKILFSNYTSPKYHESFCKENKLVTPEIIDALDTFALENFNTTDDKFAVTLKSETIFFNKIMHLTSVGYAPNNTFLEIYDKDGNHLEKLEKQINESVVFSKDFKLLEVDKKQYLVQYAYFDEKRSVNATILKVKVYVLIDYQNIKLIEELNFTPIIAFE